MDKKSFWNEVSKYGLMLGVVMGALTILMQSLVINGGVERAGLVTLLAVLYVVLFFVILRVATVKHAAQAAPEVGFTFFQGVNYMILVAIFAAIPSACLCYVYLNSILGYDAYIEGTIAVLNSAMQMQPVDANTANVVDSLVDQLRATDQPSIFTVLLNSIIQCAFGGMVVGLILSGFISRKPQINDVNGEQ